MHTKRFSPARTFALVSVAALALSACELRRDGVEEEPVAEPSENAAGTSATPGPADAETPAASILRDENAPENDTELPAEPFNLTLPFPEAGTIDAGMERMLASVLNARALEQDWPVTLSGHTDSAGNDEANLRASRARAEAVAAWLIERGVSNDRIEVIAFGEQNPIAPNALPDGTPNTEGRRANRRVELRIAPPPGADEGEEESAETAREAAPRAGSE